MKTPIAIHNLWHQGIKTGVSIGGVAFALLLVFMQLGFMGAVSDTATNVLERLRFDILLRAHSYVHLYEPGKIDRRWLDVAKGTEGVRSAKPFWVTVDNWRTMATDQQLNDDASSTERQYLPIAVMAFEPGDDLLDVESVSNSQALLRRENAMLVDSGTQRDYGPRNGRNFTEEDISRATEIHQQEFRIAGIYKLGTGLAANGAIVLGKDAFKRIWAFDADAFASLGLVEVDDRDPSSIEQIAEALRYRMRAAGADAAEPAEPRGVLRSIRDLIFGAEFETAYGAVEVLSKSEVLQREKSRWLWQTPIGLIFQLGVVLALIVGAAIVYMILSTDVANRLPEYATLLAMGYSRLYLASIVMTQAVLLCLAGFFCAWFVAEILYRVTTTFTGIPLSMNSGRVLLVGILGLLMCCVSGMLALRKLWKAEPANLF